MKILKYYLALLVIPFPMLLSVEYIQVYRESLGFKGELSSALADINLVIGGLAFVMIAVLSCFYARAVAKERRRNNKAFRHSFCWLIFWCAMTVGMLLFTAYLRGIIYPSFDVDGWLLIICLPILVAVVHLMLGFYLYARWVPSKRCQKEVPEDHAEEKEDTV